MLYLRTKLDRATELDLLLVSVLSNDDHFVVLLHVYSSQHVNYCAVPYESETDTTHVHVHAYTCTLYMCTCSSREREVYIHVDVDVHGAYLAPP